ncbi:hypothetical protein CO051_01755 [Candidatus Roizmanbacteria bacterium CG_4_9_14_0_2_um_filter_39_13]|uniref:Uncharacterized protein n=2 Tax=Candidatus Roizmaniibacteriota TaxID=1752723 RepID=A0A2M8F1V4_9BACT|nr:MAG: hypothetical protein CO051_01755 [Candidatus Roizmanbacteria bacterium CG_4_9_14_0_2_um_filter_39_13]PJE62199.1 MAG: hypothetical protein COU87_00590 [Candidatus Roizmanbacteria bacterium CG10_big_fil_rev_8_21_14_0_10_39_12]
MKRKPTLLLILLIGISMGLFIFWHLNVVDTPVSQSQIQEDPIKIHEKGNADLKERSLEHSPDNRKVAYYQNKFVMDIKTIGDRDYTSLIVEQNDKKETIFQGNFHLSYFEWMNNNKIKVYKGCGSSCLLSYIIDINTKQFEESVEKIFDSD